MKKVTVTERAEMMRTFLYPVLAMALAALFMAACGDDGSNTETNPGVSC